MKAGQIMNDFMFQSDRIWDVGAQGLYSHVYVLILFVDNALSNCCSR